MSIITLLGALALYSVQDGSRLTSGGKIQVFCVNLLLYNLVLFIAFSVLTYFWVKDDRNNENYVRYKGVWFSTVLSYFLASFASFVMLQNVTAEQGIVDNVKFLIGVFFYLLSMVTIFFVPASKKEEKKEEQEPV